MDTRAALAGSVDYQRPIMKWNFPLTRNIYRGDGEVRKGFVMGELSQKIFFPDDEVELFHGHVGDDLSK